MYKTTTRRKRRKTSSDTEQPAHEARVFGHEKTVTAPQRAIWKGSISIGLINIPVTLHPMIYNRGVKFHYLHRPDKQRLQYERICSLDGQAVSWGEVVKGYEVAHNEYVVLDPDELEAAKPKSDKNINIDKFVDYFSVDPIYFYKSYVLLPDRNGKAYSLLLMALNQMGKAGAGRITLREKEHPALVHAYNDALVLTTMRYAYDVVDPSSFEKLNELEVPERTELNLAKKIISELSGDFDINEYEDTYRLKIAEIVQKKLNGEIITIEKEPPQEEVKGLMVALQETLKQLQQR